jgi:glycosyltransferase involved in cell wall biosynthesis
VEFVNRDGETGLLVPPGDASALAGALNRLLGDAPLRERLGRAGRARVEREFSIAAMRDRTLAVYREVLAPGAAPLPDWMVRG